jgi:hypothetical protein
MFYMYTPLKYVMKYYFMIYEHMSHFRRYWMQLIGVLLVRKRAKVASAAAQGDRPRRARRANAMGAVACVVADAV